MKYPQISEHLISPDTPVRLKQAIRLLEELDEIFNFDDFSPDCDPISFTFSTRDYRGLSRVMVACREFLDLEMQNQAVCRSR